MIQSLPFIAAVGLAVIERTRLNEFAYWRSLDARVAELFGRRVTPMSVTATVPAQVVQQAVQAVQAAQKQGELVQ